MPKSLPLPDWSGEDAFIIGGGASLKPFDWRLLEGKNTIGCNNAFALGEELCKIAIFGDLKFWQTFESGLTAFKGWVATNYQLFPHPNWMKVYPRLETGLSTHEDEGLGWNFNTGAAAVNLALLLGAKRVFLLGFDLQGVVGSSHWHKQTLDVPRDETYARFLEGFDTVARSLSGCFPGREVINVTDGSSKLMSFPRMTFEDAFAKEPICVTS